MKNRKSTGPRTRIGKERSKFNALKNGLYAQVVLLSHEPRLQFDVLLHGLQRHYKPHGMLGKVFVEKLAIDIWRYRRGLQVESAEAQKKIERVEEEYEELLDRSADT